MRFLLIFCILIGFISISNCLKESGSEILERDHIIDDCCCQVSTVENSNTQHIFPLLNKIAETRFFKYFKVNLFRECPFWVNDAVCTQHGCSICECNEDEVPSFWKEQKTDLVSVKTPENFLKWKDKTEHMWSDEGPENEQSYVNLGMYEEANTGYRNGSLIWEQIYLQNCFHGASMDDMCLEERIFFRLVSGLHTSITTHIFAKFEQDEKTLEWKPNVPLLQKTVLKYPDRVKNLFFAYLFVLRAINRAAPFLGAYSFETGNAQEDFETQKLVKELLKTDLLCSPNFDESVESVLEGSTNVELNSQFKKAFRNISSLLDCVSCEKCKVFAKVQILGLGTALKILFEPDMDYPFERNEIIAMFNTAKQLSSSLRFVSEYSYPKDEKSTNSIQNNQSTQKKDLKQTISNTLNDNSIVNFLKSNFGNNNNGIWWILFFVFIFIGASLVKRTFNSTNEIRKKND